MNTQRIVVKKKIGVSNTDKDWEELGKFLRKDVEVISPDHALLTCGTKEGNYVKRKIDLFNRRHRSDFEV